MKANWTELKTEMAIWADLDMTFPLWWRDDDAITVTPQLERLSEMAATFNLPVHLAVVPEAADQTLASYVTQCDILRPVVHGWSHTNHASSGQKKAEFAASRPLETMRADLTQGMARLQTLFDTKLQPMFVPPWNRITPDLYSVLHDVGFKTLSTYGPRKIEHVCSGLQQINTHIDPIDWKNTRSLLPEQMLVDHTTNLLIRRRLKQTDNQEPLGLLTHHIIHDTRVWDFCDQLLEHLLSGPATIWRSSKDTII